MEGFVGLSPLRYQLLKAAGILAGGALEGIEDIIINAMVIWRNNGEVLWNILILLVTGIISVTLITNTEEGEGIPLLLFGNPMVPIGNDVF